MDYILNKIYKLLIKFGIKNIKVYGTYLNKITYFYHFKIFIKNETIYYYLNLRHLFSSLITFFVFCIFYYFDICIIPNNFLDLIKNLLGLLFFFKCTVIIYNLFYGLYLKFVYDDDVRLVHTISSILLFINFLINISIIYKVFNIQDLDYILQYNILYVIDFIMLNIIKLYNNYIIITTEQIICVKNFIVYPFFIIILSFILSFIFSFFFKGKLKESLFSFFSLFVEYMHIDLIEVPVKYEIKTKIVLKI